MPTYVYKFLETGETIEVQQSFDDAALTEATHPVTGSPMPVKKVYLPVGVTFRGDGFYKTDNRSKPPSSSGSDSKSDSKSDSGSSSKSDSGSSSSSGIKSESKSDSGSSSSSGSKSAPAAAAPKSD